MNIFNKVAFEGLKGNPARTLVTIVGVALSAALFTAVTSFAISLQDYMVKGSTLRYGGWHVDVFDVPYAFVEEQLNDDGVASVGYYENIGYAVLEGGKNADKPYLFIAGFNDDTTNSVPIEVYAGRMPENDREIVVSAHVGADGGGRFALGDTITLEVGQRRDGDRTLNQCDPYRGDGEALVATARRSYTVVGICQRPTLEARTAPGYTLITKAGAHSGNTSYTAYVKLKSPGRVRAYMKEIGKRYSCGMNNEVLRFLGLSSNKVFNSMLYSVGGVLIALVMIGSIFLIYNAFNISLSERTHQFGILMSVGATERQLRRSVLFEGLCIGGIGIPLGVLLGLPGIAGVLSLTSNRFPNVLYDGVPLKLVISAPALAAAVAISLATILISAWLPARRAAAVEVMACLRQTREIKSDAKDAGTSALAVRPYGLNGALALKSFRRNKRRYRSIVLSLSLSVILTVAASAFGRDMEVASERAVVYTTYDIALSMPDSDDEALISLYDRLRNVTGVTDGNYQHVANYIARVEPDKLSDLYWEMTGKEPSRQREEISAQVQFMDDESFLQIVRKLGLGESDYAPGGNSMLGVAVMLEEVGHMREAEEFPDLLKVPSITLPLYPCAEGEITDARFADVNLNCFKFGPEDTPPILKATREPYMLTIVAPWSERSRFPDTETAARGLTFKSDNPGLSAAKMREMLDGMSMTGDYMLLNVHAMLEQNRNILFITSLFSTIFIAMITLIAIANVYNTISTNLRLRRRELAMLRSVGMSDGDLKGMLRFECLLYSLKTLLWSWPLSVLASVVIVAAFERGEIPYRLPWQSMLLSAAGVVAIVSATMRTVTGRLMGENIIDAMRDEMT